MKEHNSLPESENTKDCVQLELNLFETVHEPFGTASKILSFEEFKKKKEDEEFYRDVDETVARLIEKYK